MPKKKKRNILNKRKKKETKENIEDKAIYKKPKIERKIYDIKEERRISKKS